jgi:hypothetical protein
MVDSIRPASLLALKIWAAYSRESDFTLPALFRRPDVFQSESIRYIGQMDQNIAQTALFIAKVQRVWENVARLYDT